jgi:hypothetical protein
VRNIAGHGVELDALPTEKPIDFVGSETARCEAFVGVCAQEYA